MTTDAANRTVVLNKSVHTYLVDVGEDRYRVIRTNTEENGVDYEVHLRLGHGQWEYPANPATRDRMIEWVVEYRDG